MTSAELGRLTELPLREVWIHEAKDFTTWLFNNLDVLNDQIGLDLSAVETEKSVGTFSLDLMAQDGDGRTVIIENQLEKTDHDHLGKVLTYLSNLEAKTAIWISSNPRPEHVTAINYLNEVVPEDTNFYLLKVQALRIGDSVPAPLFSIVAGPSAELRAGGRIKKDLAGYDVERYQFFEQLLDRSNRVTNIFSDVSPQGYKSRLSAGSGKGGVSYQYVVRSTDAKAELCLWGLDPGLIIKRFELLLEHKEEIESAFGGKLDWGSREGMKQRYIRAWIRLGGIKDKDRWTEIQDGLVDRMKRLKLDLNELVRFQTMD